MIVIVAGVAGSGKSTIGSLLAWELGWDFEDGDDLHSAASIAKMKAGHPLTDEDRRPWLGAVATWIDERAAAGRIDPPGASGPRTVGAARERRRRHEAQA